MNLMTHSNWKKIMKSAHIELKEPTPFHDTSSISALAVVATSHFFSYQICSYCESTSFC